LLKHSNLFKFTFCTFTFGASENINDSATIIVSDKYNSF